VSALSRSSLGRIRPILAAPRGGPGSALEPVELRCSSATLPEAARFTVTGLWGDPNPELVALSVADPEHWPFARILRVPVDWNTDIWSGFAGGDASFVRTFIRIRRR